MKTILITGIGGPTPRSIARVVRNNFPSYKLIGIDSNPKSIGFFINGLLDEYYVAPKVTNSRYWPFIEDLIQRKSIEMAFVQPENEVIGWGNYYLENGKYPCPVLIPPKNLAKALMDKSVMAEILHGTKFIPKTIKVTQDNPQFDKIENEINFPCWIRATKGSGGLGSLKLLDVNSYKSWLFINNDIHEFTVSEFLGGRHLATQTLYKDGKYIKGASLECVEYVMANIAPSKVTGNTSFGRFINEDHILAFCNESIEYICNKLKTKAHGVLSFDLKEDSNSNLKITEVNIRHMAYTGVMAKVGFDLVTESINLLSNHSHILDCEPFFHYEKPYVFLRDVDVEPIILDNENLFSLYAAREL